MHANRTYVRKPWGPNLESVEAATNNRALGYVPRSSVVVRDVVYTLFHSRAQFIDLVPPASDEESLHEQWIWSTLCELRV